MAALLLTPFMTLLPSAKAYFYLTGTSTPASVYTTDDLDQEHPEPVVADLNGRFPPIWLDGAVQYRMVLKDSGGALIPNGDVDPLNRSAGSIVTADLHDGAVTADKAADTLVTDLLGFTPLNKGGDTATGLLLDTAPATLGAGSAGYLAAPSNTPDANYTLVLADAGKTLRHTSGSAHTYLIPPASSVNYPDGTQIVFRNVGAGVLTIGRGAGVALKLKGSGTDANRNLAQHGEAVISKDTGDIWYVSGLGLS